MNEIRHDAAPRAGSSRQRFRDYRAELAKRAKSKSEDARGKPVKPKGQRTRSFGALFRAYLGLLGPYRAPLAVAFSTLALTTALAL
ncbi:MAG: hypothetical protein ACK5WX_03360, partial [bacterium]